MNVNPIIRTNKTTFKQVGEMEVSPELPVKEDRDLIMKELDKMSSINNVNISKKDYEMNLSMEELQKRTHKDYLTTKKIRNLCGFFCSLLLLYRIIISICENYGDI